MICGRQALLSMVFATGLAAIAWAPTPLKAAEGGLGFYLLGLKGPLAGVLPPEGVFLQNDFYMYGGDAGRQGQLPLGGTLAGNVTALGGTIGYNLNVGKLPVSTRIKVYREFDVANRVAGTSGFLTVSMPLWVPQH